MPRLSVPLPAGSYKNAVNAFTIQSCVNCYPVVPSKQAISDISLFGTSGIKEVVSTLEGISGANRGGRVKGGKPYVLNGPNLYRIDKGLDSSGTVFYTAVLLGIVGGEGRAFFSDNGKQLLVICGGKGFIVDETLTPAFQEITAPGFTANGVPQVPAFVDGFFLVTTDAKKIIRSNINDGLTWNSLNFGTAEADPDEIRGIAILKNQPYVAGSKTIEMFRNIAAAGFSFQRVTGYVISKGVFAPHTFIQAADNLFFVGGGEQESPAIWMLPPAGEPQKISTDAIDTQLQRMSIEDITNAFAWTYSQNGGYFIGFSFTKQCHVYDISNGMWHERESQVLDLKGFTYTARWRANCILTAYNKVFVADSQSGKIGELSPFLYREFGRAIRRLVVTPPISNQIQPFFISRVDAVMDQGRFSNENNSPISVALSWSDDAITWSNPIQALVGEIGNFGENISWNPIGRASRFTVLKFEFSADAPFALLRADMNVLQGNPIG